MEALITGDDKSSELLFGHLQNGRNVFVLQQQVARALAAVLQGQRPGHHGRDLRPKAAEQVFQCRQQPQAADNAIRLNL